MRHLSDKALTRLRSGTELPDLGGTRYRLISQVARGGMGVVYAAEDECLQRRVALKVLEISGSEGDLSNRLMREARVLARLEHPGIFPVHDAGTLADGRVFYAMKFVEGQRLDQYIESQASTPDRLRIFLRICDAVAFAHAHGVLHRDLKPANVIVGSFGEVLVVDWGLAKILSDALKPAPLEDDVAIVHGSTNRENDTAIPATAISASTGHGRPLFSIDLTRTGNVIASEIDSHTLDGSISAIKSASRDFLLLQKAEAFIFRRFLKGRDAYDILILQRAGAKLSVQLKEYLSDRLMADEMGAEQIVERIEKLNEKIFKVELENRLPSEVYADLQSSGFTELKDAVKSLFADWL